MFSNKNDFSITQEYWNSIPLSDKRAYLERREDKVIYPSIKDEESLLLVYERAMQARDHETLSLLHLRCLSLKLLPLAAKHDDLVTLCSLLQHRKPEKNNAFLEQALLCAACTSKKILTTYIRSQVPS